MQRTAIVVAVLLSLGALAASPAALAAPPGDRSSLFVAGGARADVVYPPDPVTLVKEDRATAAATCGLAVPINPVPVEVPGHDALPAVDGLGGDCFDVTRYPADAQVTVGVQQAFPSIPEESVPFAVGYDGDDDGCIGCSPADTLWKGEGSITIPVLDDEWALTVFVYGSSASVDATDDPAVETATIGEITVSQADTTSPDCTEDPGTPEGRCGVDLSQPRPHLCAPVCEPVIDSIQGPVEP